MKTKILIVIVGFLFLQYAPKPIYKKTGKTNFSGIYPELAYYNDEGECGTGALVAWANKLWVITYGPHLPFGSSDKLYEIDTDLNLSVRAESIGGTPANRMIHKESNQLFIGPYAIRANGNVRAIPYTQMPGRHTGNARHLTSPAEKIYYGTMEEGFYEVDVNTLNPKMLYKDGNVDRKPGEMAQSAELLPGAHGKGLYSGQGVMVYSNNGEATSEALEKFDIQSGALAEWNGKDWKVVRRNQFVEVTGPGGIYGNMNANDPIWATGWDHKSLLLGVRDNNAWSFYRLPKASHSYDGAHGWNTEWPRIRDIGTSEKPDYLMTMHGMFWHFPGTFNSTNTSGIRPRSAYLKVIGDFTRWNDQLVLGCDDAAKKEFLNKRTVKGSIEGPGQSNSNLWFTSFSLPDQLGPTTAEGAVWLKENVKANEVSEPFLFAGWTSRSVWINNDSDQPTSYTFEIDKDGKGGWSVAKTQLVGGRESMSIIFPEALKGEWIRVKTDKPTTATVLFSYSAEDTRKITSDAIFSGLATVKSGNASGGLLYGLGDNRRALGIAAIQFVDNKPSEQGYYELDAKMNLIPKDDKTTYDFIKNKFAIPQQVVTIDESSVLIVDDKGRRWRLPLGATEFGGLTNSASLRICREVATERDLFNCHGTFYELPAENADGFAKIRPISSHNFRIHDYASYRGMLVLTGIDAMTAKNNSHIISSADGKASVWAGTIDDLWKMGKPVGHGGPWKNKEVKANQSSDPYLIGFYDKRNLKLSHSSSTPVTFTLEAEPAGHGPWMTYKKFTVAAGEVMDFNFPKGFQSRWIRFTVDKNCTATAWLNYN